MKIQITKIGGIQMLHDDTAELETMGKVQVKRASHVEYDNKRNLWYVKSAKTLKILCYAQTREGALQWEKEYYSPSGNGWGELVG